MERGSSLAALAPARQLAALTAWAPRRARLGAYVHVPFCARRCGYCSFNTAPLRREAVPRYLAALRGEIDLVAGSAWVPQIRLATVFLGGGTPSLLEADEVAGIVARLDDRFGLAAGAEITVECNPESVSLPRLAGYREAGVNRLSLGVQSLDDRVLAALERPHTAAEARRAFEAARAAGFDNVSVDLMYGLPALDMTTWMASVTAVLEWGPDHLSAYALTLDEGSRWHAAGTAALPAEEHVTSQYRALAEHAAAAGYEHYEISNYARSGRRSAHNQVYWRAEEYVGLGPGACGFLGHVRYGNVRGLDRYCALVEGGGPPLDQHETLSPRHMLAERLMLGLRLIDGVPTAWLDERAALEPERLPPVLAAWRERGLLVGDGERARLTEEGFLLSDALFVELL